MANHVPSPQNSGDCRISQKSKCEVESKCDLILAKLSFQDTLIEEIKEHTAKLTEMVADPEKGLYGRVKAVESWKKNISKAFWIVFSALASLAFSATIWAGFIKK